MSIGRGLGQQTGNDEWADSLEYKRLIQMILECPKVDLQRVLDGKSMAFIEQEVDRVNATVTHFRATGKQLFWLRDIKDKLIERGLL